MMHWNQERYTKQVAFMESNYLNNKFCMYIYKYRCRRVWWVRLQLEELLVSSLK